MTAASDHLETLLAGINDPFTTNGDNHQKGDPDLIGLLIKWADFWETDLDDADWIAEPIIPAKRSTALFAPGGTGKSLLALYLAVNLATGRHPFTRAPIDPIRILYLDYEMTLNDLAERLEHQGYGPETDLTNLNYALLPSLPGLDQPEGGKAVLRLAELCDAELVIIDTFGRAVHGDENDADTVRGWYRWTGLHLKNAGRAFLRIDHAGKDITKGQRGTSAKNDDVDVVWKMTAKDDGAFTLHAEKRRMGWVPMDVHIVLEQEDLLRFQLVEPEQVWPAGTMECAAMMDALDIDVTLSARKVTRLLREADKGVRDTLVRAAVKYRHSRSLTFHFAGDQPVDKPVDNSGRALGTRPPQKSRDAVAGRALEESALPQVDDLGRALGRAGTHPRRVDGTRCASLRGTHPSQPPESEPEQPTETEEIW